MNNNPVSDFGEEKPFPSFLKSLRAGEDVAWERLLGEFRKKVIPYIRKNIGQLPKGAIVSEDYMIEEVFAESLFKFYELFETGDFENEGQLRGLIFRISEFKMKEVRRKILKDRLLFFSEKQFSAVEKGENNITLTEDDRELQRAILQMEAALENMPTADKEILLRFSKGEKIKNIAEDLSLKPVNCRKKKERALSKLRKVLSPLLTIAILLISKLIG